jgi:hypothetical protein
MSSKKRSPSRRGRPSYSGLPKRRLPATIPVEPPRLDVRALVDGELWRARRQHPQPFNSAHEGYAVLLEEVDELKAEVWNRKRDPKALLKEAVQVAAMAQRFIEDVIVARGQR